MVRIIKKNLILVSVLLFCLSCSSYNYATRVVDNILETSPDAIKILETVFESKKIIFVGSSDHSTINDVLFFNEDNLIKLYNKGLRYILVEGGTSDIEYNEEELLKKDIALFYPWENVGVQYSEQPIIKNIYNINKRLNSEKIQIIGLESHRQNFVIKDPDESNIYNYRDNYMFENAKYIINNSLPHEKILILCGTSHGYTNVVKKMNSINDSIYEWKTLSFYLKELYGENFVSFSYIPIDAATLDSIFYDKLQNSKKWFEKSFSSKFISLENAEIIDKYIKIFFDENHKSLDGFIMDKHSEYGIKYCYMLENPLILETIINQTKSYYNFLLDIIKENKVFDYRDPDILYKIEFLTRNLYYLKFTFGENFKYSFWNPKNDLTAALNDLKKYKQFSNGLDEKSIKEFQILIRCMHYLKYKDSKFYYKYGKRVIAKAHNLIPQEIWFYYWNAIMNFKLKNYRKSLNHCKLFISNDLAYSTPFLIDILNTAIECSLKINEDISEYLFILHNLSNELNLDVKEINLFLN